MFAFGGGRGGGNREKGKRGIGQVKFENIRCSLVHLFRLFFLFLSVSEHLYLLLFFPFSSLSLSLSLSLLFFHFSNPPAFSSRILLLFPSASPFFFLCYLFFFLFTVFFISSPAPDNTSSQFLS
jgi:hypothetical protein